MVARAEDVFDGEPAPERALAGFVRLAVRRGFRTGAVAPIPFDRRAVEVFEVVGPAGEFGRERRPAPATWRSAAAPSASASAASPCPCRRSPCLSTCPAPTEPRPGRKHEARDAGREQSPSLLSSHSSGGAPYIVRRGIRTGQDSSDNDQMTRDATPAPIACTSAPPGAVDTDVLIVPWFEGEAPSGRARAGRGDRRRARARARDRGSSPAVSTRSSWRRVVDPSWNARRVALVGAGPSDRLQRRPGAKVCRGQRPLDEEPGAWRARHSWCAPAPRAASIRRSWLRRWPKA